MKTDGLFTTHVKTIKFQEYNKPIKLWFPADTHFNSKNHSKSMFDAFLQEASQDDYQHIFLSLGDSLDTCSDSERRSFRVAEFHDDTEETFEEVVARHTDEYIAKVSPVMAGKTIGVIGGNHWWKFEDSTTTEMRIARGLKAPYLGDACYLALILQYRDTSYTHEVIIFAHHSSSDQKLRRLGATIEADIVVGAHTHQSFADPIPKLRLKRTGRHAEVVHHETRVIRGKSFLRSYVNGNRSYAVKAGYAPSEIGCSSAIIVPRRTGTPRRKSNPDGNEERWVDIKAVV
jgi:hypothetical protein